jgi:hypothetical protein
LAKDALFRNQPTFNHHCSLDLAILISCYENVFAPFFLLLETGATNARILDFGFWIDEPLLQGNFRVSICSLPKQQRLQNIS